MMVVLLVVLGALTAWVARNFFGNGAALLTLTVFAFEPTLLGHGALITTDVPTALASLATLVAFARLFSRFSAGRLAAASACLGAAAIIKFSWPSLVPALAAMGMWAVYRRAPVPMAAGRRVSPLRVMAIATLGAAIAVPFFIWAAYGFRYLPYREIGPSGAPSNPEQPLSPPRNREESWREVLSQWPTNEQRTDLLSRLVRFSRRHRMLPEPYLFGLAFASRYAVRGSFLLGKPLPTGSRAYFPVAYAVKTPLPTLALLFAGLAAVLTGRARSPRGSPLAVALAVYLTVYGALAIASDFNIGIRHLLPIYPILLVLAGASAAWLGTRIGRVAIPVLIVLLAIRVALAFPHYIGFFNLAAGGTANGWKVLADSNTDWDQDFLRLRDYARAHPDETLKLAAGPGLLPRGLRVELLVSFSPDDRLAPLTAGTYVISSHHLSGAYDPPARDEYWETEQHQALYRYTLAQATLPVPEPASPEARAQADRLRQMADSMKRAFLLNRLRHREPDARIGTSFFVFRLSDEEIARLLTP